MGTVTDGECKEIRIVMFETVRGPGKTSLCGSHLVSGSPVGGLKATLSSEPDIRGQLQMSWMCSAVSHLPGSPRSQKVLLFASTYLPSVTGDISLFRHATLPVEPDLKSLIHLPTCQGNLSHRCPIYLTQAGETPSKSPLPVIMPHIRYVLLKYFPVLHTG